MWLLEDKGSDGGEENTTILFKLNLVCMPFYIYIYMSVCHFSLNVYLTNWKLVLTGMEI